MLEAELNDEQGKRLLTEFHSTVTPRPTEHMPIEAFVTKQADGNVWRIVAVWQSREAFDAMRAAMTPRGVVMFRTAGVEPTLTLFDVKDSMTKK